MINNFLVGDFSLKPIPLIKIFTILLAANI